MKNISAKINPTSNRVLFITYFFPPAGGVGRIRIVKFLKYLQEFGWTPRVLTVKKQFYALKDESLLRELPDDLKIDRINYFEPGFWVEKRYWQSFLTYFLYPLILVPDIRVLWIWPALKRARQILKQENIKVIFTSSSSVSDHIVGYYLKKQTGVKWVADFRDEWATNAYFKFPTPLHRYLARSWEKKVIETADKVVSVSAPMTTYFKTLTSSPEKCVTLMNGFDPADFKGKINKSERTYCQIVYAGTLFRNQRLDTLMQAIKDLKLSKVKLEFFGGKVRLPHPEMVTKMRQADILLFILSAKEHPLFLTGKLFEYLASRRPILALANPTNAAAKIIKKLGVGEVAHPDKVGEIKKAIQNLYQKWQKNQLNVPEANLNPYDRRAITGELAKLFNKMTPPPPKKICLVVNGLSPQSRKLCQYLLKRGYEIHLVSLVKRPLDLPGVKHYWLRQELNIGWEPLRTALGAFNKFRALVELRQIIHAIEPDIVHGHGLNFAGILTAYSGFHPTIASTRGSDIMQFDKMILPEQYLIRQTLKKADLVTGNSLALRDRSIPLGLPANKFRLVYFGVDKEIFKKKNVASLRKKLKISPQEKIIFCPRSINHIYNIDILLKAVANFKENYKLILTKQNLNPEYWAKMQRLAAELKIKDKIILLPATDPKGMAELDNLADVVVSLAKSDGLASCFLEAMACESKIVISNVDFVKEWFKDKNFWIVPIGNIDATTKAIESALKMPASKFASIGEKNRVLVLSRAELNKGFEEMEKVYREAVGTLD